MTGGETNRNYQIITFLFAWGDGLEGYRIWLKTSHFDIPFVFHHTVYDYPLSIMRIHSVGRHPDRILHHFSGLAMVLRHDQITDHSPSFPDIKLGCKMTGVGVFISGVTPVFHKSLQFFRNPRIVLIKIQQSLSVVQMSSEYRFSYFIAGFRPVVIEIDCIRRKSAPVVDICFPVWHFGPDKILTDIPSVWLCFKQSDEQFIFGGVIVFGFGDRQSVFWMISQTYSEIVGLDQIVSLPWFGGRIGTDPPEQSTGRIAFFHERVHAVRKLMITGLFVVLCQEKTVESFIVNRIIFPTHGIGNTRCSEQVPFVSSIDENLTGINRTILHRNGPDRGTVFAYSILTV